MRWEEHPVLRNTVLIAAFEGWNDAADAASNAVTWLRHHWRAKRFASLDPDDFYDFQATRPRVSVHNGVVRSVRWPANEFSAATVASGVSRDVVLLSGVEPNVHWQTFCSEIVDVARSAHCELVVTLGALLAEVPHTRPVRLTTTAVDADLIERLHAQRSRYEGPTGIVGVLHHACHVAGLASVSLWAPVPHYVATPPNPKATAALVEHVGRLLSIDINVSDLWAAARVWEERVSELVTDDDEVAAYVRQLEARADAPEEVDAGTDDEVPGGDDIAAQIEQYLRDQDDDG